MLPGCAWGQASVTLPPRKVFPGCRLLCETPFFQFHEGQVGVPQPLCPSVQNPVLAPSSALPGPRRAKLPVPASVRGQVQGWGLPCALVTWMVGRQGSGSRGKPSTLAVPVYMQAHGAGPQPASPLQQVLCWPSCWYMLLGPASSSSLLPKALPTLQHPAGTSAHPSGRGSHSRHWHGGLAGAWN